jgi:hypothetical protein
MTKLNAYIFRTNDTKNFKWYIDYFKDINDAEKNCKIGYNVSLYVTTRQQRAFN